MKSLKTQYRAREILVSLLLFFILVGVIAIPLGLILLTGYIREDLPHIILMIIGGFTAIRWTASLIYRLLIEPARRKIK